MDKTTKRLVLKRLKRHVSKGGILSLELSDFLETFGETPLSASCEARQLARVRADLRHWDKKKGQLKTGKHKREGKKKPAARSFYKSRQWAEVRYAVLERSRGRCECCGVSPSEGAQLNVDHIVPVSKAWDRRLDPTNLQVLCGSCNRGKSNKFSTDWRETAVTESGCESSEVAYLDKRFSDEMRTVH